MGCAASSATGVHAGKEYVARPGEDMAEVVVAPPPFKEGTVRDFRLQGKLGQGVFATVHAARNRDGKHMAMKVLDLRADGCEDDWQDASLSSRKGACFMQEVSILEELNGQAHIVQLFGSFVESGLGVIAMERCDLTLLQALNRLPSISEGAVCDTLREMLLGVAGAHGAGVVHRDVKPESFLYNPTTRTVKLIDFGLAERLPDRGAGLQGVVGTPPYMCPEMLKGDKYDHKADTWSFGVILYSLFFGRFPYQPTKRTGQAMKEAILVGEPAPNFRAPDGLEDARPVSSQARDLAAKLLDRNPALRLSAEAALQHRFFRAPGSTNLEPMLLASARVGGFTAPRLDAVAANPIDRRLADLQAASSLRTTPSGRPVGAAEPSSGKPCEDAVDNDDESTDAASLSPASIRLTTSSSSRPVDEDAPRVVLQGHRYEAL